MTSVRRRTPTRNPARDAVAIRDNERVQELKKIANIATQEKKLLCTRRMTLDRELQRRERQLRTLLQLRSAGLGLGMDLLEKIREERNVLPIYRKKLQELHGSIAEREVEISNLKHDERFTRIIELQVEYASWQHEVRRLSMLIDEATTEEGITSQQEKQVLETRVAQLKAKVAEEEERQRNLALDCQQAENMVAEVRSAYELGKSELCQEQEAMKAMVEKLHVLLDRQKEAEVLEQSVVELQETSSVLDGEIGTAEESLKRWTSSQPSRFMAHQLVSEQLLCSSMGGLTERLGPSGLQFISGLLRSGVHGNFLRQAFALDEQQAGFITLQQLEGLLVSVTCDPATSEEFAGMFVRCLSDLSETGNGSSFRLVDALVALDRFSDLAGPPMQDSSLPDLLPLRAACLRKAMSAEQLRQRVASIRSAEDLAKLFCVDLSLSEAQSSEWLTLWRALGGGAQIPGRDPPLVIGSRALLARVPVGEVAMTAEQLEAWLSRCRLVLHEELPRLETRFGHYPSMRVPKESFSGICAEEFGGELSADDVEDLSLLFAEGDQFVVNGIAVVNFAKGEQRA